MSDKTEKTEDFVRQFKDLLEYYRYIYSNSDFFNSLWKYDSFVKYNLKIEEPLKYEFWTPFEQTPKKYSGSYRFVKKVSFPKKLTKDEINRLTQKLNNEIERRDYSRQRFKQAKIESFYIELYKIKTEQKVTVIEFLNIFSTIQTLSKKLFSKNSQFTTYLNKIKKSNKIKEESAIFLINDISASTRGFYGTNQLFISLLSEFFFNNIFYFLGFIAGFIPQDLNLFPFLESKDNYHYFERSDYDKALNTFDWTFQEGQGFGDIGEYKEKENFMNDLLSKNADCNTSLTVLNHFALFLKENQIYNTIPKYLILITDHEFYDVDSKKFNDFLNEIKQYPNLKIMVLIYCRSYFTYSYLNPSDNPTEFFNDDVFFDFKYLIAYIVKSLKSRKSIKELSRNIQIIVDSVLQFAENNSILIPFSIPTLLRNPYLSISTLMNKIIDSKFFELDADLPLMPIDPMDLSRIKQISKEFKHLEVEIDFIHKEVKEKFDEARKIRTEIRDLESIANYSPDLERSAIEDLKNQIKGCEAEIERKQKSIEKIKIAKEKVKTEDIKTKKEKLKMIRDTTETIRDQKINEKIKIFLDSLGISEKEIDLHSLTNIIFENSIKLKSGKIKSRKYSIEQKKS